MAIPVGVPVIDVSRIIEWVVNAGVDFIKWLALRALILGAVSILVPLAIYSGWLLINEKLIAYMQTQMTGDFWSGTMVELTGLAAWIGIRLQFQACFTILATALGFRFVLGFFKK